MTPYANWNAGATQLGRAPLENSAGALVYQGCAVCSVLGLLTPNPLLTAVGMMVPCLIFRLLWRVGEPPVLAFAACFQWLQVISPVLAANFEGRLVSDHIVGVYMHRAAWLSLGAIIAMTLGMAAAVRIMPKPDLKLTKVISQRLNTRRLFIAYLISLFLSIAFTWVAFRAGGLRQPILAFALIKWVPLFFLSWTTLQCDKPKFFMLLAVLIEVAVGFTSYFSSFKEVLFLLLVVISGTASDRPKMPLSRLAIVGIGTLLLVTFWQAIKFEYRGFLNQGTDQQVVLVSLEDRMKYLAKATTRVTPEKMVEGFIEGVDRLGYIKFFAYSMRNVPRVIPHQDGKLWIDTIKHVFMPRIFFPNKPVLHDSIKTNYYTGLNVADHTKGTSIGIGYMGESYIDFGPWFMMIPVFLLGYFYGRVYRYFVTRDHYHLSGFAIATAILLFSAMLIETSNIKLVGGITTSLLAFGTLQVVARDRFLAMMMDRSRAC